MSKRDRTTLDNPTRDSTAETFGPTAESIAWPDLSMVSDLVSIGVSIDDAWEMPPNMTMRLLAISAASMINPKHRTGGGVQGTKSQLMSLVE